MSRSPNWSLDEFRVVLVSYGEKSGQLAERLPGRTLAAIELIKQGIHGHHRNNNVAVLSKSMKEYLKNNRRSHVCPVCGVRF